MAMRRGRGRSTTRGPASDVEIVDTLHHPQGPGRPHPALSMDPPSPYSAGLAWNADSDRPHSAAGRDVPGAPAPRSTRSPSVSPETCQPDASTDTLEQVAADVELPDRDREQLVGHLRIEPNDTSGQVHLEAQEGPQEQERGGRGPGLRRARRRVAARAGRTSRRSKPQNSSGRRVAERGRRVEQAARRPGCASVDEAVARQPGRDEGVVVRPDRAVVVAHRVVGAASPAQRADAPAGEHLAATSARRHLRGVLVVDDAGPQAVAHVGRERVDRALVARRAPARSSRASAQPERLVEAAPQRRARARVQLRARRRRRRPAASSATGQLGGVDVALDLGERDRRRRRGARRRT